MVWIKYNTLRGCHVVQVKQGERPIASSMGGLCSDEHVRVHEAVIWGRARRDTTPRCRIAWGRLVCRGPVFHLRLLLIPDSGGRALLFESSDLRHDGLESRRAVRVCQHGHAIGKTDALRVDTEPAESVIELYQFLWRCLMSGGGCREVTCCATGIGAIRGLCPSTRAGNRVGSVGS